MKVVKKLCFTMVTVFLAIFLVNGTVDAKAAHQHRYNEQKKVASTCTKEGQIIGICSCGARTTLQYLPKKAHNYSTVVSTCKKTCTKDGVTVKRCSCGATTQIVDKAPGYHIYSILVSSCKKTCTKDGVTVKRCACGATTQIVDKAPGYHTQVVTKSIITNATYDSIGQKLCKCEACNSQWVEAIPVLTGYRLEKYEDEEKNIEKVNERMATLLLPSLNSFVKDKNPYKQGTYPIASYKSFYNEKGKNIACGPVAHVIAINIITGKSINPSSSKIWDGNNVVWNNSGVVTVSEKSNKASEATILAGVANEISVNKKPCVICYKQSNGNWHYVVAIGLRSEWNKKPVQREDIICIDPYYGGIVYLDDAINISKGKLWSYRTYTKK